MKDNIMQELLPYEINQISGGLGFLGKTALIITCPITIPLGIIALVISLPIIGSAAAAKLGSNLCDYYTGWDQITGWNGPTPVADHCYPIVHPIEDLV